MLQRVGLAEFNLAFGVDLDQRFISRIVDLRPAKMLQHSFNVRFRKAAMQHQRSI
jgi:hypothetical protein|tara:strand:- start:203 stop:367 length:165 start_codon:yes stop_codon:yes gene_type:complete